jgi:hypothetical protein
VIALASDGSTLTLKWSYANSAAQAWLFAHHNPAKVTFSLTGAFVVRSVGGNIQPGDFGAVEADGSNPSSMPNACFAVGIPQARSSHLRHSVNTGRKMRTRST